MSDQGNVVTQDQEGFREQPEQDSGDQQADVGEGEQQDMDEDHGDDEGGHHDGSREQDQAKSQYQEGDEGEQDYDEEGDAGGDEAVEEDEYPTKDSTERLRAALASIQSHNQRYSEEDRSARYRAVVAETVSHALGPQSSREPQQHHSAGDVPHSLPHVEDHSNEPHAPQGMPHRTKVKTEEPDGNPATPNPLSRYSQGMYPPPEATQQQVLEDRQLFMQTLRNLHEWMGNKFRVPVVSGQELDLHVLYSQVCMHGGLENVITQKRWPEVTVPFNFPPSFTSRSFTMRKIYSQLLWHYEQTYCARHTGSLLLPAPAGPTDNAAPAPIQPIGSKRKGADQVIIMPPPAMAAKQAATYAPPQQHPSLVAMATHTSHTAAANANLVGTAITGMVDARFDCGYFVTITAGGQEYKGVLYCPPAAISQQQPFPVQGAAPAAADVVASRAAAAAVIAAAAAAINQQQQPAFDIESPIISSMAKKAKTVSGAVIVPVHAPSSKDSLRPKQSKTPFNYFAADVRAKAKEQYPEADQKVISKIVGEMWQQATSEQKQPYIELARKDRERYEVQLQDYNRQVAAHGDGADSLGHGGVGGGSSQGGSGAVVGAAAASQGYHVPIHAEQHDVDEEQEEQHSGGAQHAVAGHRHGQGLSRLTELHPHLVHQQQQLQQQLAQQQQQQHDDNSPRHALQLQLQQQQAVAAARRVGAVAEAQRNMALEQLQAGGNASGQYTDDLDPMHSPELRLSQLLRRASHPDGHGGTVIDRNALRQSLLDDALRSMEAGQGPAVGMSGSNAANMVLRGSGLQGHSVASLREHIALLAAEQQAGVGGSGSGGGGMSLSQLAAQGGSALASQLSNQSLAGQHNQANFNTSQAVVGQLGGGQGSFQSLSSQLQSQLREGRSVQTLGLRETVLQHHQQQQQHTTQPVSMGGTQVYCYLQHGNQVIPLTREQVQSLQLDERMQQQLTQLALQSGSLQIPLTAFDRGDKDDANQ